MYIYKYQFINNYGDWQCCVVNANLCC